MHVRNILDVFQVFLHILWEGIRHVMLLSDVESVSLIQFASEFIS